MGWMKFYSNRRRVLDNINNLLLRIEEMSISKKDSISKIDPFALGMLNHLAKIYVTGEKSNWFGTVRKEIDNIQKVRFAKKPSRFQYYRYMYSRPIQTGLDWMHTPLAVALSYKDHVPTEQEVIDFDTRVRDFLRHVSVMISIKNWQVKDHKHEIDQLLDNNFRLKL